MVDNVYLLIFYGVVLLLVLVASFLLFYIKNQSVVWKQKRQFQESQIAQQKELLNAVIDSQEVERKRIGQDLHDEIGGTLSAIKLMLNSLRNQLSTDQEEVMSEAKQLIDKMIVDVRHISHDLSPPGLAVFGLFTTIEAFVTLINNTGEIKISIEQEEDIEEVELPEKTALALFRVLTQLVDNTIKHANATEIAISFKKDDDLQINYQDNGKGFDLAVLEKRGGIGMQNIQSRLQMVNAVYKIDTEIGKGFRLAVSCPLSSEN
ncbi:sensor histidine kinase [Pedobacter xixiisoli]|uniref:histidine kinase n=1 Tax=Pedobacter xixiisoli TaxID=1476464 RepID=A0A285ZRC1_9SPHI|nr:histidine kinase [Pedobacter xixiisoli]SOD12182.1 Signal transduction histidine kinase [Pedobacter xixiisoli]